MCTSTRNFIPVLLKSTHGFNIRVHWTHSGFISTSSVVINNKTSVYKYIYLHVWKDMYKKSFIFVWKKFWNVHKRNNEMYNGTLFEQTSSCHSNLQTLTKTLEVLSLAFISSVSLFSETKIFFMKQYIKWFWNTCQIL